MQRPRIQMFSNLDRDGSTYFIGRVQFPGTLDFADGFAFLFYPESEQPELQFCALNSPDLSDVFEGYKQRRPRINRSRHGNLPIELHVREEKSPEPGQKPRRFYIGKIQFNGEIKCKEGVMFFAYIADPGEEELQIAPYDPEKAGGKKTPQPQRYSFTRRDEDE